MIARSFVVRFGPGLGIERDAAAFLRQPQDQRDGERAGGEGDHNAGDDHGLRNGIEREARRRAAPRDNAEHEEDPAADEIEGQQLAQGMRVTG